MHSETYTCPLCGSGLSREQYEQVTHIDDARRRELEEIQTRAQERAEHQIEEIRALLEHERRRLEEERRYHKENLQRAEEQHAREEEATRKRTEQLRKIHRQELEQAQSQANAQTKHQLDEIRALLERERHRLEEERRRHQEELQRAEERRAREAEALKRQIEQLQRHAEVRVRSGPESEEALIDALRRRFLEDNFQQKGRSGVIQTVMDDDKVRATIVYSYRNTSDWLESYVRQLKELMEENRTRYGVLVSRTLPSGESGLCLRDGVLVVSPELAHHVAEIIRGTAVELGRAQLPEETRNTAADRVYRYMLSEPFRAALSVVQSRVDELRTLLARERRSHETLWGQREQYYDTIARQVTGIEQRIRDIISQASEPERHPRAETSTQESFLGE